MTTKLLFAIAMLGGAIASQAQAQPKSTTHFSGKASFYDQNYKGTVASGGRYRPDQFTCAHKTLPFGTHLKVTDVRTNKSVVVTVNDRGPFSPGRVLDLSYAAAKALAMIGRGVITVRAEVQPRNATKHAARAQHRARYAER